MGKTLIQISDDNRKILRTYAHAGESLDKALTNLIKEKKIEL